MVYVPMTDRRKSVKIGSLSHLLDEDEDSSTSNQQKRLDTSSGPRKLASILRNSVSSIGSALSLNDGRSKKVDQLPPGIPIERRPSTLHVETSLPPPSPPKETTNVQITPDKMEAAGQSSVVSFLSVQLPSDRNNMDNPLGSSKAKEVLIDKLQSMKNESAKRPSRTFHIWHPKTRRKSITVMVGDAEKKEDPFNFKSMHTTSYETWKKQAKQQLPSAGGPPIKDLEEVIHFVPSVQKETNQKVVDNTIRRLSILSNAQREYAQENSPQIRTPPVSRRGSSNSEGEVYVNSDSSGDDDHTIVEVDSDEDMDRQQRKTAGIDIRVKLQALREFNYHLTDKRLIRQQLVRKATGFTIMDAENIPLKEHLLYLGEYIQSSIHDFFKTLKFWDRSIIEINGRFGVFAGTYFIWLRRIVILNAMGFIASLLIIIIPQIVGDFGHTRTETRSSSVHSFSIFAILHGEHSLHRSYMFYSGYDHRNENHTNPLRNPAVRFLLCMMLIYLYNVCFIFTHINTFYSGIRMKSKVSGVSNNLTFLGIICGWDFSCEDPTAAIFLRKTIQRELHVLAAGSTIQEKQALRIGANRKQKLVHFFVVKLGLTLGCFLMHLFSTALLLGSCTLLGLILQQLNYIKLDYFLECIKDRDDNKTRKVKFNKYCPNGDLSWESLVMSLPALFSVVATQCLSVIIGRVGDMESWATSERRVYATMIRAGLLYGTTLQVLYWFWSPLEKRMEDAGYTLETIFAKELYRIVVLQGLLDITVNLGIRKLYHVVRSKDPKYRRPEFPSEYHALQMFSLHSISQLSTMFSPGLRLIITLRLVLDFYRHRYALFHLHGNESYSTHASLVSGPYLVTYFLTFLLVSFMNLYFLSGSDPSDTEGPFVTYKSYDEALRHLVAEGSNLRWLKYVAGPGFLSSFIALLLALVYFNWQWSKAYQPIIIQLNEQIFLDRSDREVLLKAIYEIGRAATQVGEGEPEEQAIKYVDSLSSTTTNSNLTTASSLMIMTTSDSSTTSATSTSTGYTTRATPTSTNVSTKNAIAERMKNVVPTTPQPQPKQDKKQLDRLLNQVKREDTKTLAGLERTEKASVTVNTWNAQRQRRLAMEKIVKGIVQARHSVSGLAYDPSNKIFPKSNTNASNAPNQSKKPIRTTPAAQLSNLLEKTKKSTKGKKGPNEPLKNSKSQQPGKSVTSKK